MECRTGHRTLLNSPAQIPTVRTLYLTQSVARRRRKCDRIAGGNCEETSTTVNDRFVHDAGDVVLKQVAGRIRGALRAQDTVARWAEGSTI